ncbi:MAG TPA: hypothetical protein VEY06_10760 [Flavisolibacter sp.]|nr:hypothetical protein [Flavisolibacter sp.]
MNRLPILILSALIGSLSSAQLPTPLTAFPTQNSAAQTVVIKPEAAKGNIVLLDHTPTTGVYVHLREKAYSRFQQEGLPAASGINYFKMTQSTEIKLIATSL